MTTFALDVANRSATFLGACLDALGKAIAMRKAVRQDCPTEAEIEKVRAIAETI